MRYLPYLAVTCGFGWCRFWLVSVFVFRCLCSLCISDIMFIVGVLSVVCIFCYFCCVGCCCYLWFLYCNYCCFYSYYNILLLLQLLFFCFIVVVFACPVSMSCPILLHLYYILCFLLSTYVICIVCFIALYNCAHLSESSLYRWRSSVELC